MVGTFHQRIAIAATPEGPFVEMQALVDTGATYTLVPSPILEELGVTPFATWPIVTADGRTIEKGIGFAILRLNGEAFPNPCIFGDPGTEPLLGAVTLEIFRLAADPVGERLIPVPGRLA